mgnify:CR=1 FL=1
MKLLVDAGNTRLKWLLVGDGHLVGTGSAILDADDPFCDIRCQSAHIRRVAVSTVISEERRMGADRWHAMYAAWQADEGGFAVVDAGSAITIDYVADTGAHLGGYILPGKQMMLRSLRQDAARIGFDVSDVQAAEPGASTTECVQHGLVWLWASMAARIEADCRRLDAGLSAHHEPSLVLKGLAAVDGESERE